MLERKKGNKQIYKIQLSEFSFVMLNLLRYLTFSDCLSRRFRICQICHRVGNFFLSFCLFSRFSSELLDCFILKPSFKVKTAVFLRRPFLQ